MKLSFHLKHALVPHHGNHHRPHLIRPLGLAIVAAVIALQQVHLWTDMRLAHGQVLAYASDITPTQLLQDTNIEREKVGLAPLRLNAQLNSSAAAKANDMFQNDYWAHVSPSGVQPWYWFDQAGYKYSYAGENLAKGFDTSEGVTQGWMNSPTHRENLLNSHYVDIGFAVVNGTLQGEQTTLVVAHYGAVQIAPVVAAATPAPSKPAVLHSKTVARPVAAPVPTPVPTPVVVKEAPVASTHYSVINPLRASDTLATTSKISLSLLLIILGIMLWSHLTVWRRRIIHGYTHGYRLRVAAELALVSTGAIMIIVHSFGSVT